ncbi:hypothetical protein AGABI1DRAFT_109975 [Agaricus bisporus var. burnettii JB137-S8]|uniref:GLUE N-terminal domain-containing protein n=1 Tax=Agaricus bisporus var. burnettii (strain JB137-S8 / ATCC MYA-4627 / FGSC 10392) TaxID=597362 RepID=K5WUD0_AGABU|nr:uncharacterized protein AGABI1DRAFT_109975 [Agaricus bisporus var. burnettii JB137-S8]EKM74142.1 hypothetical protein AGABI1DRAFT_109975 [Agaricus bisporus var. burnettii JB137-S8]
MNQNLSADIEKINITISLELDQSFGHDQYFGQSRVTISFVAFTPNVLDIWNNMSSEIGLSLIFAGEEQWNSGVGLSWLQSNFQYSDDVPKMRWMYYIEEDDHNLLSTSPTPLRPLTKPWIHMVTGHRDLRDSGGKMALQRYMLPVDGTIPVQALLYTDEQLYASQEGVGIYNGLQKSPPHQSGTIYTTSHQLFYIVVAKE